MQGVLNNAPMNVNDAQPNQTVFSYPKFHPEVLPRVSLQ